MVARDDQHLASSGSGQKPLLGWLAVGVAWGFVFLTAASLVVPRMIGREASHISPTKSDMSSLESALAQFQLDANRCPTTEEGVRALLTAPASLKKSQLHEPYLDHPILLDEWGNEFIYKATGKNSYTLMSYGADGKPGGTGENTDIVTEVGK